MFPLRAKTDAGTRVAAYLRTLKNTRGIVTKAVFSDNGSEFAAMHDYATSEGILLETSLPNTQSQNGRVERCMRTVKECARAMLSAACLTDSKLMRLWFYAYQHAANIWNHMPRKSGVPCPNEQVFGSSVELKQFIVFGSPGNAKGDWKTSNSKPNRAVRYLGIQPGGGFTVFDVETRKVIVVRDAKFFEDVLIEAHHDFMKRTILEPDAILKRRDNIQPDNIIPEETTEDTSPFHTPHSIVAPPPTSTPPPITPLVITTTADTVNDDASVVVPTVTPNTTTDVVPNTQHVVPQITDANTTVVSENLNIPQSAPRLHRSEISATNIVTGRRRRTPTTTYYLNHLLALATLLPPKRFRDIAGRIDAAKWLKEYLSEVNKLATKGEMIVVARPLNARVIQIQELFSIKEDNILNVTIPKVRIVARGDLEVYTDPVYAPVANMVALRLFVVLSLDFGTYFRQLDITAAFLYGRVKEPIYIELPQGHPQKAGKSLVWRTNCAIYGLSQSPKIWYETIDAFLREYGLKPLITEPWFRGQIIKLHWSCYCTLMIYCTVEIRLLLLLLKLLLDLSFN